MTVCPYCSLSANQVAGHKKAIANQMARFSSALFVVTQSDVRTHVGAGQSDHRISPLSVVNQSDVRSQDGDSQSDFFKFVNRTALVRCTSVPPGTQVQLKPTQPRQGTVHEEVFFFFFFLIFFLPTGFFILVFLVPTGIFSPTGFF